MGDLRAIPLSPDIPGRPWLPAMPGRYDGFGSFARRARAKRPDRIVRPVPFEEPKDESREDVEAIRRRQRPWQNDPPEVSDHGVPEDRKAWLGRIRDMAQALRAGERALVHCGAGGARRGRAQGAGDLDRSRKASGNAKAAGADRPDGRVPAFRGVNRGSGRKRGPGMSPTVEKPERNGAMSKILPVLAATLLMLAGCAGIDQRTGQRTLVGGAVGAAAGAAAGVLTGGIVTKTVVGGAAGAVGGLVYDQLNKSGAD